MPFVPASVPAARAGVAILALAFTLGVRAIVTIHKAGTQVETYKRREAMDAAAVAM